MALRAALTAIAAAGSVLSDPLKTTRQDNPVGLNFNWGGETIHGANIGGWLILEPYATCLFYVGSIDAFY